MQAYSNRIDSNRFYLNKLAPEDCHTWHETPYSAFVAKNKFYLCIYVYILMHFIFWMCSVRVHAALDSQRLERDL